jgi:hypothetical protein
MKTALHIAWVSLLAIGAMLTVHYLCAGSVRCEERCGAELWFAAFSALVACGLLGWRVVECVAERRGWR